MKMGRFKYIILALILFGCSKEYTCTCYTTAIDPISGEQTTAKSTTVVDDPQDCEGTSVTSDYYRVRCTAEEL